MASTETSVPATELSRSAAYNANIERLVEELALQQTILASLEDASGSPAIADDIRATKRAILKLKQELSEARGTPPKVPKPLTAAKIESQAETDYLQLPHRFPHTPSPSGMSTPGNSSSSGALRSQSSGLSRKRSFSNAYMGRSQAWSENKSRKTTPSPMDTPTAAIDCFDDFGDNSLLDFPVIDLTGDDEDLADILRQHKEAEERLNRNKAAIERDAAMAQQLSGSGSTSFNQPPSSSQGNAFDRILGRNTQSSRPSSQTSQPNSAYPVFNSGFPGAVKNEAGLSSGYVRNGGRFTAGQSSSLVKPESGYSMNSSNFALSSSNRPPTIKPEFQSTLYRMPGSFLDDFEEDLGGFMNGLHPLKTESRDLPPIGSSLLGNFPGSSVLSGSSQQTNPTTSGFAPYSGNQSPFAGLATNLGFPQDQKFPNLANNPDLSQNYNNLASAFDLGAPRPGHLTNGGYLPRPSLPVFSSVSALSDVIKRTGSYDYNSLVDGNGMPLDSRLANYIDDYVNDPRKTEEDIQQLLSNIRPDMDIPQEARGETPEALKYPLYVHQQLALKWMVDMEEGTNKGGILADDMGLGKTISSLALMVTRKSEDNVKTNLIIGPVALIRQWEHEIKKKLKSSHSLSVFLLYGKKARYADLKLADVVLTTYGSLASEWKRYNQHLAARADSAGYSAIEDEELQKKCPLLHPKSKFYRVILDEAQLIKNKDTQSSQAVHQINAVYRWCLSGTPMMNGVSELYPLFRFLRIKPYCVAKKFTEAFKSLTPKSRGPEHQRTHAMRQLQAVLKATMLRRMKNSEIDGKPILTLPEKTETQDNVEFSQDEKSFYSDLEGRSQVQFNKYLRAGTVGKNYSNILVLLLRLRQACCHPHLMDFECANTNEVSEDRMLTLAQGLSTAVVERIKAIESFECPICYDGVPDPTILIPCGHDTCSECFASLTDNTAQNNIRSGEEGVAKCPVCRGPAEISKIINYTAFQKVHMPEKLKPEVLDTELVEEYEDSDSDFDSDVSDFDDNESLQSLKNFIVPDDAEDADEYKPAIGDSSADVGDADEYKPVVGDSSTDEKPKPNPKKEKKPKRRVILKTRAKGKVKAEPVKPDMLKTLRHEAGKNKEARRRYMHYLRDNWEDSAKVTRVLQLLEEIQETGEKTIIFSQWTALLDLIECQVRYKLREKYCCYTGAMSRKARDDAVQDFVENPRTKVMLVSLRAGNAGLNLTVASHVIICDPFWNPYIEMQAVDRAHRIGQQREVKVHRILIEETVEDRIIELQRQKRELVDAALDEGESRQLGRLNNQELAYLFGVGPRSR